MPDKITVQTFWTSSEEELAFDSYEKVKNWQEIALALLRKYTERYYTFRKREWELPHLEYRDLAEDDPNLTGFPDGDGYYRILIDQSQEEIVQKLTELKAIIESGDLKPWEFHGLKAIWFGRHLYEPLLYLDKSRFDRNALEINPVPLNLGERRFVEDLKDHHDQETAKAAGYFASRELYLLRNMSKGRGVGFFEAGNFHPDFIVWVLDGATQHIAFVDPKGIRNLGPTDPKLQFYTTVKDIEARLGDPAINLHSFIISNTPSHTMRLLWGMDKAAMNARHILFQEEDKASYIKAMLEKIVQEWRGM